MAAAAAKTVATAMLFVILNGVFYGGEGGGLDRVQLYPNKQRAVAVERGEGGRGNTERSCTRIYNFWLEANSSTREIELSGLCG